MNPYQIVEHQGNPDFTREVAEILMKNPIQTNYRHFPDGELYVQLDQNVREHTAYIIYSLGEDINRDIVELILLTDTLKRSSASKIVLVAPYFPYCRQDRKCIGREPISASAIARLFEKIDCHRIISMDLHNPAIQGFTTNPFDNLTAEPLFHKYIKEVIVGRHLKLRPEEMGQLHNQLVIVSPDEGGAKRTSKFKDHLNDYLGLRGRERLQMVTMVKRRGADGEVDEMTANVPVTGKVCVIIDDICDTGGTLMKAVSKLKGVMKVPTGDMTTTEEGDEVPVFREVGGAEKVFAMITHALLNDKPPNPTTGKPGSSAVELIMNPDLEEMVITNTVYLGDKPIRCPKLRVLDVTEMFATAITLNQQSRSTKELFEPTFYKKSIDWYMRPTGKASAVPPSHPHLHRETETDTETKAETGAETETEDESFDLDPSLMVRDEASTSGLTVKANLSSGSFIETSEEAESPFFKKEDGTTVVRGHSAE